MAGVADIAKDAGVDADLVRRFLAAATVRLKAGERVIIHGLGSFSLRELPARTFNTRLTNGPVHKPARRGVAFDPSDKLLAELNGDRQSGHGAFPVDAAGEPEV